MKETKKEKLSEKKRIVLRAICLIVAVAFALLTITFFVYPFIKAFILYQGGLVEQSAFDQAVAPLIIKSWLKAFVCGVAGTFAVTSAVSFTRRNDTDENDCEEGEKND